jgi:hypothetical protein
MTKRERAERKGIIPIRKSLSELKKNWKNLNEEKRVEGLRDIQAQITKLQQRIMATEVEMKKPLEKVVGKLEKPKAKKAVVKK